MNMATDTFIYIYVHEIKERVDVVRRKVCYWLDNRQWPHHRHRWGKGQPRPPFPVTHWSCHNWRLNLGGYVAMFPASHPTFSVTCLQCRKSGGEPGVFLTCEHDTIVRADWATDGSSLLWIHQMSKIFQKATFWVFKFKFQPTACSMFKYMTIIPANWLCLIVPAN